MSSTWPPEDENKPAGNAQPPGGGGMSFMRGCFISVLALLAIGIGLVWYTIENFHWTKGRPLRGRRRRRRRPEPDRRLSGAAAAAAQWRAMAGEEHESIAAFGELALDLTAAGAPAELVNRCHHAALEEAGHTQACLDVATLLDGHEVPLAAPPLAGTRRRPRWRRALLVRLAVESYLDGCIGEGSAARVLGALVGEARQPEVRGVLRVLAREEMGHARLGRDVVRWCRAAGGPVVDRALALTCRRPRSAPLPGAGANLREYGVADAALRQTARARATATALAELA